YPLVWVVNLIANSLLRLFGLSAENGPSNALTREELRTVVSETRGLIPQKHRHMLLSVLDLEQATVEDIMAPRNEIIGIDLDDEWDEITTQLSTNVFRRRPVYRGNIDNVVGFLHMDSILAHLIDGELTREQLETALSEAYYVPEGTPLTRQLLNFQSEKQSMALIVDEYGDLLGLITLEDLLEEIVGEFSTDPGKLVKDIHPRKDGTYLVDGGMHIRELNRALGWKVPSRGQRTVNGLILEYLEHIPEPGVSVLIDGYPMEIVQIKNNAVKTVRMQPRLPGRGARAEL
ncbi:MAG: HlyC/CorC family transporter, partial [Gammaproteobacteria bacterium]